MSTLLTAHDDRRVRGTLAPTQELQSSPTKPRRPSFWVLIDRSDEALLDFDTELLDHEDIDHARVLLAQEPIFRNHLAIAKFLEGWIDRVVTDAKPSEFNDGFIEGLVEMMTHLRDGDFAMEAVDEVG